MRWFSRAHMKYYAKCALAALPIAVTAAFLDSNGYRVTAISLVIAASALVILLIEPPPQL